MFVAAHSAAATKLERYAELAEALEGLLAGEPDPIANLANAAALINDGLDELNWAGFYLMRSGELVLGPFQGKPACVRIPVGKGVCGTAVAQGTSVLVDDVHAFPGHIACDSRSNSEIVVPVFDALGHLIAVFDVDSERFDNFDATDREGLEKIMTAVFAK